MAENEENNQETAAAPGIDQPGGPQFALQRIYLKDASFESPRSPLCFRVSGSRRSTSTLRREIRNFRTMCGSGFGVDGRGYPGR